VSRPTCWRARGLILGLAAWLAGCTGPNPAYKPFLRRPVPDAPVVDGGSEDDGPASGTGDVTPPTVSLGAPADSPIAAPSSGGSPFTGSCGAGQALVGVNGTSGGSSGLDSVQGVCADLVVQTGATLKITTSQKGTIGPYGVAEAMMQQARCGPDQVIVGFEGRSGVWLDELTFHCARLMVTTSGADVTIGVATVTTATAAIGPGQTAAFAALSCATGLLAIGMVGGAGSAVDRFGLRCARPSLQ
jgi:hypothetical protein